MNTIQIRIKRETKKEIDELLNSYVTNVYNQAEDIKRINNITKKGLSCAEYMEFLIKDYKKLKPNP